MQQAFVDCWNCGKRLRKDENRTLRSDATCPACGEYLNQEIEIDSSDLLPDDTDFDEDSDQDHFSSKMESEGSTLAISLLAGGICSLIFILIAGGIFLLVRNNKIPARQQVVENTQRHEASQVESSHSPTESELHDQQQVTIRTDETLAPNSEIEPVARKKSSKSKRLKSPGFVFADGDEYRFQFEVSAEFDRHTEVTSGTCTFEVKGRDQQKGNLASRTNEGSGTAFVVNENGLLATCAHVVDDADDIEVHLNGKVYSAEVVDLDNETDLALLKIQAKKLTALKIADSDSAQLGMDVRALGYPLSDVLGTNIKVTRGTVSGIMNRNGQKQLQIDAAVNPGNSGGPVVNSKGELVGIASAKLSGLDIHRVGFCVPSNTLRDLIKKNGTKSRISRLNEELKGPELVESVTPSVAYVKVKSGPDPLAKHSELNFQGSFRKSVKSHQGHIIPSLRLRGSGMGMGRGTMLLTQRGEIVRTTEEEQLPFLLGPPSELLIFEFPKGNRSSWTRKSETSLIQEKQATTASGIPLPRFRDPFGRRRNSKVVKVIPAVETKTYTLESDDEKELIIKERYEFKTSQKDDGQTIRMLGTGTLIFDKIRGMTSRYDFKGTYMVESEQVTLKVPVTVSARLLSRKELETEKESIEKPKSPADKEPSIVNSMGTAPRLEKKVHLKIPDLGWGAKVLTFSPDNKYLVAGKADEYIEVYDINSGEKVFKSERLRDLGNLSALAFSPDGKFLLAGGFKGVIKIWKFNDEAQLEASGEFLGHAREVSMIEISPDNLHVLSGSAEKRILCWDLKTQKENFALSQLEYNKSAAKFTDDKTAFLSDGRKLLKVDVASGTVQEEFELRDSGSANNVFFDSTASTVAITDGYSIKRWQTKDGLALPEFKGKQVLWDAVYSMDGQTIVAGGRGHLVLWDINTQKRSGHVLLGNSILYVKPVEISPDGKLIACYPSAAGQDLWVFDFSSSAAGKTK